MAWDDNANVCGAASVAAEAVPEIQGLVSQSALEENHHNYVHRPHQH